MTLFDPTPVHRILERLLAEGAIPSLSLDVRHQGREVFHRTLGLARREPPRPAVEDQAYDLASLTKALVATPVCAALVERGVLDLEQGVQTVLPDVDPRIRLRHLLDHSSGALWWRPYFEEVVGQWGTAAARQQILDAARREPLVTEPGTAARYSDTGFLLLLQVLEAAGGRRLDHLFDDLVLQPAGVDDLQFGWPTAAATEHCPIREALVEGTVHDPNCAAMGGISAHAGLFGTARAVSALCERLIDAAANPLTSPLPGRTLRRFWDHRGPGSHALGWDRRSPGYASTGAHFPDDTVGHLGFTGCSVWFSPSRQTVVTLLTNRIHDGPDLDAIRAARPAVHDAVAEALGWAPE